MRISFVTAALALVGLFLVGCDRIANPVQNVVEMVESDDMYTPKIQYWHVYDDDALSVSWDPIPGAAQYVVSLEEDHGGPMGTREETLTWQIVKGTSATFVRNPRYFADRVNTDRADRAKWFAVNILPVTLEIENRLEVESHPWDYHDIRVEYPMFIPIFCYREYDCIDRLQAFVDTYGPKPEVLGFEIYVTGDQVIILNPPDGILPAGVQYQVIAYGESDEVLYSDVRIAIGTGSDAPLWRERGITLPDGIRAHSVSVRPVWEVDRHWITGEWDITEELFNVADIEVEVVADGNLVDMDQQLEIEGLMCQIKLLKKEVERIEAGGAPGHGPTGQDLEIEKILCQINLLFEHIEDLE